VQCAVKQSIEVKHSIEVKQSIAVKQSILDLGTMELFTLKADQFT
jgi:hypothetical protein